MNGLNVDGGGETGGLYGTVGDVVDDVGVRWLTFWLTGDNIGVGSGDLWRADVTLKKTTLMSSMCYQNN